jgi:hypothetical protein
MDGRKPGENPIGANAARSPTSQAKPRRKVGRPKCGVNPGRVRELRDRERMSWRKIGRAVGASAASCMRLYAAVRNAEGVPKSQQGVSKLAVGGQPAPEPPAQTKPSTEATSAIFLSRVRALRLDRLPLQGGVVQLIDGRPPGPLASAAVPRLGGSGWTAMRNARFATR